jgi:hypothetical protein
MQTYGSAIHLNLTPAQALAVFHSQSPAACKAQACVANRRHILQIAGEK